MSEENLKNRHIKQMNKLTKIIRNSTIDELWRYYNHKLLSSEYTKYKKYGLFGWEDLLRDAFEQVMNDKMSPTVRDNMIKKLSDVITLKHKRDRASFESSIKNGE